MTVYKNSKNSQRSNDGKRDFEADTYWCRPDEYVLAIKHHLRRYVGDIPVNFDDVGDVGVMCNGNLVYCDIYKATT